MNKTKKPKKKVVPKKKPESITSEIYHPKPVSIDEPPTTKHKGIIRKEINIKEVNPDTETKPLAPEEPEKEVPKVKRENITLDRVDPVPEPEIKEVEPKVVKPKPAPKKKYEKKIITLDKFEVKNKTAPVVTTPANDTEEEGGIVEEKNKSVLEPIQKGSVNLPPEVVANLKKLLCDS